MSMREEEQKTTSVKEKIMRWEVAVKKEKEQQVVVARKAGKIIRRGDITPQKARGMEGKEQECQEGRSQEQNSRI